MNRSQTKWLLVVIGTLLWVLVVYPAYYVVHKPLSSVQFQALLNIVTDLLTWLAMLGVATALGSRLTRRLAYHSLLERITFSAGLGLVVFSLITLGLSLVGLLYGWLFWVLLLGGGLLLWCEFRDLARALRQVSLPRPDGAWSILLTLFVVITLLLALIITLLPPTEWDSLVYHLVGPDRYLQAHRMTFEFDNYYLFFPSLTEMLFLDGMALKSDVVPRLIHFSYLLLTLGALGAFAKRYWSGKYGLLAVALFLSIPTAVHIATWSYVDLALTFYNFCGIYALLNWLPWPDPDEPEQEQVQPGSTGWLLLAGLSGGASLSIKYTGVVTLLVLAAILLWALLRRRLTLRSVFWGGLVVAGSALVLASPWYIKNAIVAGNPIYPLVWGGRAWNEIATRWMLVPGQEMNALDLLAVPWTLTVIGTQGTVAYDATTSPLFLALLPLLLVVRRRARGLAELLLAAAVGYAFWLISGAAAYGTFILRGRQVLPIFAPLSLLCAYALEGMRRWDRKGFSLHRFLRMLVILTLAVGLLGQVMLTVGLDPWPYLAGLRSREQHLEKYTSQRLVQTIEVLNETLTPDDKVLFVWEPRTYGLRVPHDADIVFDNYAQRLALYGSPEAVVEGLRSEGFTHLLVNEFVYPWMVKDFPITPEEQAAWEEFRDQVLTADALVHAEEEILYLYRLPSDKGP